MVAVIVGESAADSPLRASRAGRQCMRCLLFAALGVAAALALLAPLSMTISSENVRLGLERQALVTSPALLEPLEASNREVRAWRRKRTKEKKHKAAAPTPTPAPAPAPTQSPTTETSQDHEAGNGTDTDTGTGTGTGSGGHAHTNTSATAPPTPKAVETEAEKQARLQKMIEQYKPLKQPVAFDYTGFKLPFSPMYGTREHAVNGMVDFRGHRSWWHTFQRLGFIFVHIPKCGGTAVENLILNSGSMGSQHYSAVWLRSFDPAAFAKLYKFTVVRNPYSRMVSAFEFMRKGGNESPIAEKRNKKMFGEHDELSNFTDFVDEYFLKAQSERDVDWDVLTFHFRPQYWFLLDVEASKDGDFKLLVDDVAHLEHIAEDLPQIEAKLKRPIKALPHARVTKHVPYDEYYTAEQKAAIARVYSRDFDILGYPK